MQTAIPAVIMRGGTSKGLYFAARDLPRDTSARNEVLLAAMGSPDVRQIDGLGGAHPLTSKVAVIAAAEDDAADVDYLFLQVFVDRAEVSDGQNCGNILAGVGPYAIERGIVNANDGETDVRIRMLNTGGIAVARVQTPDARVTYEGDAHIDGVPGQAAPVFIDFADVAGKNCGALLPTANVTDVIDDITVTCIDNGMPVVILAAANVGKTGYEPPETLEADEQLCERIESIRLQAGERMNLGDVTDKTVPKISLVTAAAHGGVIMTRTFIPHRVHQAIGVLGAASVAAACRIPGTVAYEVSGGAGNGNALAVEHPTGAFEVEIEVGKTDGDYSVNRSALLRTARKLMQGTIFVPQGRTES